MAMYFDGLKTASVVAVICMAPMLANALDITAEAGYGAEYTNNSAQTPNNEIGEWIQAPELTLDANHKGPSSDLDVNYRVRREIHQKDTSQDETIVDGLAKATWQAIADRLTFNVSNVSTQTTIDSRGTTAQDNLQVTNTAQAGSVVSFGGFANHQVQLGYLYTDVNADETNTDSVSNGGTFAYIVPLDPSQQLRLNAMVSDVNFEQSTASDYIARQGGIEYDKTTDSLDLKLGVGYAVFDLDDAPNTEGTTGDITVTWRATGVTTLSGSYSRSIEQGAIDAQGGIPQFGEDFNNSNSDLTEPYTSDDAELTLGTTLGHNEVTVVGYYSKQNYDGVNRDQDVAGGTLGISRKLRPTLTARLFGDLSKTDYQNQGQRDDDLRAIFSLEWTRWHRLSVTTLTTYTRRNSNLETAEYDEWSGAIRLMYTLVGRGR